MSWLAPGVERMITKASTIVFTNPSLTLPFPDRAFSSNSTMVEDQKDKRALCTTPSPIATCTIPMMSVNNRNDRSRSGDMAVVMYVRDNGWADFARGANGA